MKLKFSKLIVLSIIFFVQLKTSYAQDYATKTWCSWYNSMQVKNITNKGTAKNEIATKYTPGHRSRSRALWLQVGLGGSRTKINTSYNPSEMIHNEASLHFRKRKHLFSIGLDGERTDCWGIDNFWGTYGYSYYNRFFDASVSAGIGFTDWYYHTESELGTIKSKMVQGLIIKMQAIQHFPQVFGVGVVITININREASYYAGSLVFSLGGWNW